MNEQDFLDKFESGTLPESSFHHQDHVRMAFIYLCRYPVLEAIKRFSAALRQFAKTKGKDGLYHETITWAYLLLIHERISRSAHPQTWDEFAGANPDLLDWKRSILKKYYSDSILNSDLARRVFVLPRNDERSITSPA